MIARRFDMNVSIGLSLVYAQPQRSCVALQHAAQRRYEYAVIYERYALIQRAVHAVSHLAWVQHTRAAVYHHAVGRQVVREARAASSTEFKMLASILHQPARYLDRADVIALAVMGTAPHISSLSPSFNVGSAFTASIAAFRNPR